MAVFPTSVCLRHVASRSKIGLLDDSGDAHPSRRFNVRPGAPVERHELSATCTLAQAQALQGHFESVGFHVPFGMTAPGDSAARAYRFVAMRERWLSNARAEFVFSIQHVPGIAVPT